MNEVFISGGVVSVKIMQTKNNKLIGNLTLAVKVGKENTIFIDVKCFKHNIDIIQTLKKGEEVLVNGSIMIDEYLSRDNQKKKLFYIIANRIFKTVRLGKQKKSQNSDNPDEIPF